MTIMNRKALILGLIFIGSIFSVAEQANAACRNPDEVCSLYGTALTGSPCVSTNFCEDEECLGKNLGMEI